MRTEGDFIKINEWLLPLSWLYGLGVRLRNWMFNIGLKKSRSFDIPVISVGNITVGGSGKTPHVEYLINLLHEKFRVAVLSRGYKRKSSGYLLADKDTTMPEIGDEPFQMKSKYKDIYVAVDKNRCHGIDRLTTDEATKDVDAILLDDAYQHRYVKPGRHGCLCEQCPWMVLHLYETGEHRERQGLSADRRNEAAGTRTDACRQTDG